MFQDKRPFDEVVREDDGDVWKQFKQSTRKEVIADAFDFKKATEAPAIEETMLLDTIRAMRRDRKELAK